MCEVSEPRASLRLGVIELISTRPFPSEDTYIQNTRKMSVTWLFGKNLNAEESTPHTCPPPRPNPVSAPASSAPSPDQIQP